MLHQVQFKLLILIATLMEVSKILNKKILAVGTILATILFVGGVIYTDHVSAASIEDVADNFIVRYKGMDRTLSGLTQYKEEVERLQKDVMKLGVDRFFSTITFARPVSVSKTEEIISIYNIEPQLIYVLAEQEKNGKLVTIGIHPQVSQELDIESMLQASADDTQSVIVGVEAIIGYVSSSKIKLAQSSQDISLVDISADEHIANNPGHKDYMQHFGWDLYYLQ